MPEGSDDPLTSPTEQALPEDDDLTEEVEAERNLLPLEAILRALADTQRDLVGRARSSCAGEHREGLGKSSRNAGGLASTFSTFKPTMRSVAAAQDSFQRAVGVVPLHARTREKKVRQAAQDSQSVRRTSKNGGKKKEDGEYSPRRTLTPVRVRRNSTCTGS